MLKRLKDFLPDNQISRKIPDLGVIKKLSLSVADELHSDIVVEITWDCILDMAYPDIDKPDVKTTGFSRQTPTAIRCKVWWKEPEEIECWVSEIGWALGAGYMYRWHKPPVPPDDETGIDTVRHFFGIPLYKIMGEDDVIGDTDNSDLVAVAAEKGYWQWEINCAYRKSDGSSKMFWRKWKEADPSLAEDGSRPTAFPGWEGRHPFLRATEPRTGYESRYFYCLPKNGKNKRDVFVKGL